MDLKTQKREALRGTLKLWKTCPKKDGSLESILISMGVDYKSGLGNQVYKQEDSIVGSSL
jgi:hypothetical protein